MKPYGCEHFRRWPEDDRKLSRAREVLVARAEIHAGAADAEAELSPSERLALESMRAEIGCDCPECLIDKLFAAIDTAEDAAELRRASQRADDEISAGFVADEEAP